MEKTYSSEDAMSVEMELDWRSGKRQSAAAGRRKTDLTHRVFQPKGARFLIIGVVCCLLLFWPLPLFHNRESGRRQVDGHITPSLLNIFGPHRQSSRGGQIKP